jgi:ABC-type lipoprotein export system ATPase subunit/GNAT superfamily N-acetyltransferase
MQDSTVKFPKTIDIKLQSEVFKSFKCQVAANSLDIDIDKKSIHHLHVENVNMPKEWNIGLIYGASGSGKTTLATTLFGKDIFSSVLNPDLPIIEQFPKSFSYEECAALLNGIGLNSVPCWIRPVKTLSNGQQARAEAALLMCQDKDIVFIDEWTSVVDRTVAKAMSVCIHKFAKKHNKRLVLLSCHYDILEWLKPDWLIDCNTQKFELPRSDDFFFSEREQLQFDIREIGRGSWRYFSKYHYLSELLPGGKLYLYGLFLGDIQIGFQCFANYTPHRKGTVIIYHSNRTVVHPDYNGLGLGIKLINETSKLLKRKVYCRIMAKFSSIPVFKAMRKQPQWKFLGETRLMGKMKTGGNMDRKSGFRDKGVKSFNFEYFG